MKRRAAEDRWPLPNLHLGVSVEDQATADERIRRPVVRMRWCPDDGRTYAVINQEGLRCES